MKRFWESVPRFFDERLARILVDEISDYFKVRCTVRKFLEKPGNLRVTTYGLGIPRSVSATKRFQIEAFAVAWGRGLDAAR